jgi:hypothetical protein
MTDLERVEKKLDLILDALGLSDNRRLTPNEKNDAVNRIVLQFRRKRGSNQLYEREGNS